MPVSTDVKVLFATRISRLFGYGLISVVLVLYLSSRGFPGETIGVLLTLTLVGDTLISLYLTTRADHFGRRKTLIASGALMILAGIAFAFSGNLVVLLIAATIGVISPSGNEVGPFLAVEQVALSETSTPQERTRLFAWYNLAGSFATAIGALVAGMAAQAMQERGHTGADSYRPIFVAYAVIGIVLLVMFLRLSKSIEAKQLSETKSLLRLGESKGIVARLSALFALDSFGGGFVVQSLAAWWFHLRFGLDPAALGKLFFGANLIAGFSSLAAVRIASKIGLLRTMVFTHLPSNVLLILVPLMPNATLAVTLLLLRFSISQMDVPTRQSFVMAVVPPHERSAATGVIGVARTIGASLAPLAATPLISHPRFAAWPFFIAGGLKIVYDLALLYSFRKVQTEELAASRAG